MNQLFTGQHQHETAGAVRVFNHSRGIAGLSEQCRLLIARVSGNGYFRSEYPGIRIAVNRAGWLHFRQHRRRYVEFF